MNTHTFALGETDMITRPAAASLRRVARLAGLLYLTIIVAGIFAEFVVRSSLIVSGDAAATAENIMASAGLFRAGIAGDLIMILADVLIAILFYVLLKPVNRTLALVAAVFRLAQAATLGINLLNLFFALQLVSGADYLSALGAEKSNALVLMFVEAHATGYRIALVFFAFSILVLGYLLVKSGYFPRILGIGMIVAAGGYLTDSLANFLLINYADYEAVLSAVVFTPAIIAELSLCVWLLWKGVKTEQTNSRPLASSAPTEGFGA